MMRWSLAVLPALALVAVATPVDAQLDPFMHLQAQLQTTGSGQPIAPVTGTGVAHFQLDVRCDSLSAPPLQPIQAQFSVSVAQPYATVLLAPQSWTIPFAPTDCLTGVTHSLMGTIEVSFSKDAPAFAAVPVRLMVDVPMAPPLASTWTERPDVFFHTSAQLDRSVVSVPAGGHAGLHVVVQNFGNGPATYRLQPAEGTSSALDVVVPGPFVVPPFGEGTTVQVDVSVPSGTAAGSQERVVLLLEGVNVDDPSRADAPLQLSGIIRVEGRAPDPLPEELPAPNGVLPTLAVVAVAALLRRLRS